MRETAVKRVYSENADFQKFEVLKTNRNKRYKYGEFFVEGVRNLNEAVKNGWEISSFLYSSAHGLSGWAKDMLALPGRTVDYDLAPALLTKLSGKEDPSELMAVGKMRAADPARWPPSLTAPPTGATWALSSAPAMPWGWRPWSSPATA